MPAADAAAAPVAAFTLLSNKPPPPARASGFVHPQVRTLPPPPLPRLLQSDDRAGIGHRHLPRCHVRALLTKLSAEPSLLLEGDLAPFFLIRPHPRRELRLITVKPYTFSIKMLPHLSSLIFETFCF
jgi:hypothetical protein